MILHTTATVSGVLEISLEIPIALNQSIKTAAKLGLVVATFDSRNPLLLSFENWLNQLQQVLI